MYRNRSSVRPIHNTPSVDTTNLKYMVYSKGSYMSVHVLLNLLNEFGNRDTICGLQSILSGFFKQVE